MLISIPNRDYNLRAVLVFSSSRGRLKHPEEYLPRLEEIAKEVFTQSDIYANSTWHDGVQIGFTPVRVKMGVPHLADLVVFDNRVRQEFSEYSSMIFHNSEGHNWGKEFGTT